MRRDHPHDRLFGPRAETRVVELARKPSVQQRGQHTIERNTLIVWLGGGYVDWRRR